MKPKSRNIFLISGAAIVLLIVMAVASVWVVLIIPTRSTYHRLSGELDDAITDFHTPVALRRARLASHEGHHAEALELIEPLIARSPRGRRLHCEAGYLAYRAEEGAQRIGRRLQ